MARKQAHSRTRRFVALAARATLRALAALLGASALAVLVLRHVDPPTSSIMLQRQLEARRHRQQSFRIAQHWIPLAELPPELALAVLSAEDQRFFFHHGFDLEEVNRALDDHLEGAPLRGASTLSQQVAKNLFLWEGRSLARKALEAQFTLLLELLWPKRRILEVYLNIAELGRGVFGVGAAAEHHFGCDARELSASQAALLAAILPNPRARDPRAPTAQLRRKQRWILGQMATLRAYVPERFAARGR